MARNGTDRFSSWNSRLSYATAVAGYEITLFLAYPWRRRLGGACIYLPSCYFKRVVWMKQEKKLKMKNFWACHLDFPNHLPESISQLLHESRRGEISQVVLSVRWRIDRRKDVSWSKGCSDKIGDVEVWRGGADTCSQMGTELNIPLNASVCCSTDKPGKWKTSACRSFQAQLSYNIIKELEPVLSRVWFQTAELGQTEDSEKTENQVLINCTWLKENQKTG